jgi:opacity protein-like surface antigen
MNRLIWTCVLLVVLAIGVTAPALAQYTDEGNQKLAVSVGLYSPSGTTLRDGGGSLWKSVSIGYKLGVDSIGRPTNIVALAYSAAKKDQFDGRRISLNYMRMFHANKSSEEVRGLYYGAGVGVNLVKEKIAADDYVFPPIAGEDKSGTQFGFNVVAGYDLSASFFVEVQYSLMSELAKNVNFSGLMLSIGTRTIF